MAGNPGPATQTTVNTQAVLAPITNPNANSAAGPIQGTNARRLLAVARSVNLGVAANTDTIAPIINSLSYLVEEVWVGNVQVSGAAAAAATAAVGVYTASQQGGTAIVTKAITSTLSSALNQFVSMTVVAAQTILAQTVTQLYVNVATSFPGATCDVFVFGVDLT